MIMICSKCGGKSFHKKGIVDGIQQYKCVTRDDGITCGCRKQPVFLNGPEEESEYLDIFAESVKLAKKNQKYQDINRIERKTFREYTRVENAVIEYAKEIRNAIQENPMDIEFKEFGDRKYDKNSIGIVHLSDLHLNELVDIIGNKYDFSVASKRLKLFADKIKRGFNADHVSTVYVVMTGDLLNSDRRVDELLSMATNRGQATFLAAQLLSQFIVDLSRYYHINVISVTGNESRIREDYTQLDIMATDNFDYMIYQIMEEYLKSYTNRIKFISGTTFEYILSVNGTNILIVHGHRLGKMSSGDLSKAITKWAKKGHLINMIMCGHLHETNITDTLLRTGSLVGNNAYADVGLNLHSRASQNYYVIDEHGNLDATKVDLQSVVNGDEMYDIMTQLEAYNAKSIDKLRDTTHIITVVV